MLHMRRSKHLRSGGPKMKQSAAYPTGFAKRLFKLHKPFMVMFSDCSTSRRIYLHRKVASPLRPKNTSTWWRTLSMTPWTRWACCGFETQLKRPCGITKLPHSRSQQKVAGKRPTWSKFMHSSSTGERKLSFDLISSCKLLPVDGS